MIRLGDAAILAGTKLRTRKIRTIITALLASLLFIGLVFVFTVAKGGIESYKRYSNDGLSGRYMIRAKLFSNNDFNAASPELIAKAKERHQQIITEKKLDAKRLNIIYDPASEPPVVFTDGQGANHEYLNFQNNAVQQIVEEHLKKQKTSAEVIKELAQPYNPKIIYSPHSFGDTMNLTIMKNGKEDQEERKSPNANTYNIGSGIVGLSYLTREVVNPFMLAGANTKVIKDNKDAIPVIVPYKQAEQALNLKPLPKDSTSVARLERIEKVKSDAVNVTFDICYRNSASAQLIETVKQQITEIKQREKDTTYQKPDQIYALPDPSSCGAAVVVKDTRTAQQKAQAEKQTEFNLKYGMESAPVQKKLTMRIVGVSSDIPDFGAMNTVESFAMSAASPSLSGEWVIPSELVDDSIKESIIPVPASSFSMPTGADNGQIIEFSSETDARRFMVEQGCSGMDCDRDKPFTSYFGTNKLLIDDLTKNITQLLQTAGAVVAGVAIILMMGMVGRVITDSRRETAVFRAIGAKRNDIRLIYALYVIAFSSIIGVISIVGGISAAWIYNRMVSDSLTTSMRLIFIQTTEKAPVNLVDIWPEALAITFGGILLVGLTAMLWPLMHNLARNPLKDMRDE